MKHDTSLMEYLKKYKCGAEFTRIDDNLRLHRSKNSPWSINYYISRGQTLIEATESLKKIRERRRKQQTTPTTTQHWIEKGLTEDEAIIRSKKYREDIGSLPTLEKYIIRYGDDDGIIKWKSYCDKISNRQETFLTNASENRKDAKLIRWFKTSPHKNGAITKKVSYDDYDIYCDAIRTATKLSLVVYGEELDPVGDKIGILCGKNGWALDHKYSKYGGFVNKIHPLIIGSIYNLQLISTTENSRKGQYCSISLDEIKNTNTILQDESISKELRNKINEIFID